MRHYLGVFINEQGRVFYVLLHYQKQAYCLISQGEWANMDDLLSADILLRSKRSIWVNRRIYLCLCLDAQHIQSTLMQLDLSGFQGRSEWWQHEAVAVEFSEYIKTDIDQLYWDWSIDEAAAGIRVYYTDKAYLQVLMSQRKLLRLQSLSLSQRAHDAYQQTILHASEDCASFIGINTAEKRTACGAVMLGVTRYGGR